jgi:nanoRNase/pAp phosphatase (c-di-AMP/oligoRNAs hydrolase)
MRTHIEDIDLGDLCKAYGGGGHKLAAAFSGKKSLIDDLIVQEIDIQRFMKDY